MSKRQVLSIICLTVTAICGLNFANNAAALQKDTKPRKKSRAIKVEASSITDEVRKKLEQEPEIAPRELATYGNELIKRKGFRYEFEVCDYLKATNQFNEADTESGVEDEYVCPLIQTDGKRLTFRISDSGFGGMCSECFLNVPAVEVTAKEMMIVAGGKQYRLKRPKTFALDEMYLMDDARREVLRTWQVPYQTIPIGISPDTTKVYVDFYTDTGLDKLVLEVSETGVQFRAREDANLEAGDGEWLDIPRDETSSYLSFKRFYASGKAYIVKFEGPCT